MAVPSGSEKDEISTTRPKSRSGRTKAADAFRLDAAREYLVDKGGGDYSGKPLEAGIRPLENKDKVTYQKLASKIVLDRTSARDNFLLVLFVRRHCIEGEIERCVQGSFNIGQAL